MRVEREVVGVELLGRLGVRGVVQQNRAQNRLFGVDVRGQSGVEVVRSGMVAMGDLSRGC